MHDADVRDVLRQYREPDVFHGMQNAEGYRRAPYFVAVACIVMPKARSGFAGRAFTSYPGVPPPLLSVCFAQPKRGCRLIGATAPLFV